MCPFFFFQNSLDSQITPLFYRSDCVIGLIKRKLGLQFPYLFFVLILVLALDIWHLKTLLTINLQMNFVIAPGSDHRSVSAVHPVSPVFPG